MRAGARASRLGRFFKAVALTAALSFVAGSGILYVQRSQPLLPAPLSAETLRQVWPDSLVPASLRQMWPDSLAPAALQQMWEQSVVPVALQQAWPDAFTTGDLFAWARVPSADAPPPLPRAGAYVQTRFADCPQFFPRGALPRVPAASALRELCFTSFAILHSGRTKTPVFVAQRLDRRSVAAARAIERTDRFYAEARLPRSERAQLTDYRGSGYARGHMAPAGDMSNREAMAQSFSLANMVPQHPIQNSGAWNRIEQDTRKYVQRAKGDVYVFTGPVYGDRPREIGAGQVAVPDYLFKVVHDAHTGRTWVHWQANGPDAVAGPPISYAEFVRRTGLHLLPAPREGAGLS